MKKSIWYVIGMLVSIILVGVSVTVLGNTKIVAPVMLVLSIYLCLGCLIKLCKMNDKLKNTILCAIDLLFWLP